MADNCNVCGSRDLACPKCQPENWASRWRAQRLRAYWMAVDDLKRELAAARRIDGDPCPECGEVGLHGCLGRRVEHNDGSESA